MVAVSRRRAAAWLLLFAALAPALRADYRDAYKRGLDAIEQKKWDEAAKQMRQAIGERPEAAGLLATGTLFRRYTPHYWLGVALTEQNNCREALAAFDTAQKQGKLSKDEERTLLSRRQSCQQRVARTTDAVAQAQREVDAAAASAFQVAGVEGSPVLRGAWHEGSPSLASRQEPALARLSSARALLSRADQELDPERAAEAGRAAQQARKDLEALLIDATARRDALQVEAQSELAAMQKSIDEGRRTVSFVNRSLAPLPVVIAKQCQRVDEALTRAAAADLETPIPELHRLQDVLRGALRELRAAVKPPPDELLHAAAAYLAADYAGTLAQLATAQLSEPRAVAHACLLRAAALFGQHGLQPANSAQTLDETRIELQRCVALPSAVKPPATAFPPAFVALYDEVAAAKPPG